MKIAIPVGTKSENPIMYDRFGRTPYFYIYDTETNNGEIIENPAANARGGAGIQTVESLVRLGIKATIVPALGPNAERVLRESNIEIYQGQNKNVKELLDLLEHNKLERL
ncbi:MAG: NifB/NifX family molybdenum-iron cluster-binding protein [Candidatus Heimdallarchaeaceae archaeon]